MEFVFIIQTIPNHLKNDGIVGDIVRYFFKSKWYDISYFEKLKEAKDANEEN
jgi:hypothetical protein